jgi:hypothetical protein
MKEARASEVRKAVERDPAWSWLLVGNSSYLNGDHLVGVPAALVLLEVASSSDPRKFCIPPDHAPRCSESHTTSSCHRDAKKASSIFALRIAYCGIRGLLGPYDHPGQLC